MTSSHYSSRPFQSADDYELIRQLLIQTYPLTSPPLNCLVGEIDWWRSTSKIPDVMSKVTLWFDDLGTLVAFVWPGNTQVDVMIRPNHRKLERTILPQVEQEFRQSLTPESEERGFAYWSYEQDHVRNAMLEEFGYKRVDAEYLTMYRMELAQLPPSRALPAGYHVRSFAGESEIEGRVNAHRAAFHPSKMTVEKHRNVMASPSYRQELDLVCTAPDGPIAACTIVWYDEVNHVGIFEPVGCHPEHQRKGLASAVMCEGLRKISALGGQVAHVMSHREDSPGAYTYRALGFEVVGRIFMWEKKL